MDETVRTTDDEIAADGATSSDSREHEQESPDLSRRPPSQPRISWSKESAKRRQGFRRSPGSARADDRVKSSEDSERPDGLFRTLTGLVQAALRWRRLDSVTPGNSQASDSRFLDASKKTPGTKDDSIALKSTQDQVKGNGVHSEYKTSRYINPAYVPRYSDSEDPDIEDVPEVPAGYRAYESGIYSVNAGGTPVPITIEETVPDDVPSDDEDGDRPTSKSKLHPTRFNNRTFRPKLLATAIWRKTYRPDSNFIYYWLMLVTLAVLYNFWIIPLRATFYTDIQTNFKGLWLSLDTVCDVIYLIDIFIKFRTRRLQSGLYEKDRAELFHYHRKEWTLVLDVISVFPTDLFFVITVNPFLRMNRAARVYRAYKLYQLVELRTNLPFIWRLLNLLHWSMLVVHYNACFFYTLSIVNGYGTTSTSWAYPDPSLFPDYAHFSRQYSYSFYWSLSSLFWNTRRALPESDWQFAYTIYVDIFGFALTTFVIGYVTVLLLGSHSKKQEFERSMLGARRFLKERHLPKELRHRVELFYQHIWLNCDFDQWDETSLLRHLPISVREEISLHGNYIALKQLPELAECDSNLLRELVTRMRRRFFLPGQTVYRSGDVGSEMYIVGEGVLQIIKENSGEIKMANEGAIFGEMNIFNVHGNRRRTCDVISCGYSELFVLTSDDVATTLKKYPRVMGLVMQEARRNRAMLGTSFYAGNRGPPRTEVKRHNDVTSDQSASQVHVHLAGRNGGYGSDEQDSGKGNSNASSLQWSSNYPSNESPDSAVLSTPTRRTQTNAEGRRFASSQAVGMIARPDIVEKLNTAYEENLFALKRSLDNVWQREVATLQKQLADTELERDNKVKEVLQLRLRAVSAHKKQSAASGSAEVKQPAKEKTSSNTNVRSSKAGLRTNVKIVGSKKSLRKRTLLPSTAESPDEAGSEDEQATPQENSAIQETPLDVYGSLTSLPPKA